jgi:hypothetical protein|tara:strand:- start:88 stop:279 length:192 start_codon:yes stop_codon:yes gene_type:complete
MTIQTKDGRIDFFFSFSNTYWSKTHGFWKENKKIIMRNSNRVLYIFNFGWRNFGFFFFKETNE